MKIFIIQRHHRTLILEDDFEVRVPWFRARVPHATLVRNPLMAIEALRARPFDFVFLDADLPCPQNRTGVDVAKFLVRNRFRGQVIVHSYNSAAVRIMKQLLRDVTVCEFSGFEIQARR